ncbi:MAG TPA: hybrid sensor histidine kinase/response regulator, partial [Nitrospiraceae bacterium]|nr:hybrid sensor histidine kinase/response regulator [Nitrospiraceae bacterium]
FFTTKEVGKGTGLGLSIAYGIIKQHEGYINCYSERGMGTTFKIYLPEIDVEGKEEKPAGESSIIGGSETILLAEDDNATRKLTKEVLVKFGYNIIEAVDGEEAVLKFSDNKDKIQLLLLDVIMPKKNGREAFNEIDGINPGIKTIFMSGYTDDIIHEKGILEEGINFLTKPVSPKALLKKVREVLDEQKG